MPGTSTTTAQRPNPVGPVATSCSAVQNIRVNVHFLQHDDGSGNFASFDDGRPGTPGTSPTGYTYAQGLIGYCNNQMDQNQVLRLAPGNSLTPIPKRVRWVLDGVYFDRSSFYRDGAAANGSPFHDYAPLCIWADSVVNIFLVEKIAWLYAGLVGNSDINSPLPTPQLRGYVEAGNSIRMPDPQPGTPVPTTPPSRE